MSSLIEISNLKFRYQASRPWVLQIPKFEMKAGEKVFLLGPSGSGKSTFLEILSGVLEPTEGDVVIAGSALGKMSQPERDHFRGTNLGYIFQSFNLIPYLSIRENIELPARLNPKRLQRIQGSLQDETQKIAQKLGLADLLDRQVHQLSVGQQQRVAACRALLGNPSLILADEPTSALDYDHREKFLQLLFEVAKSEGSGILFVSHDRSLKGLFDRALDLTEINQVG